MDGELVRLEYYCDLISVLIGKELKVRYKSTIFGYLWSVANPLAFALTFFIAFRSALKIEIENYLVYLLVGMFPWQFFVNSITQSPSVFLSNANLIKKVTFPRIILIVALIGNNAIHFVLALPILFAFMAISGVWPPVLGIIFIPILFLNQFLLILGLASFLGTANLFFRDMENLTVVLTNMLFYLTPVLYQRESIPTEYQGFLNFNPMALVIELWHQVLMYNQFDYLMLLYSFIYNIVILIVGLLLYFKLEKRFAEVV